MSIGHRSSTSLWVCALLVKIAISSGCATGESGEVAIVAAPESSRELAAGRVVGFQNERGGHAWLGLPFAEPPVGDRRWRAPEPLGAWTGERRALEAGPACPQLASPLAGSNEEGVIGDEDCLYLNVYAPPFDPGAVPTGDARLPVMFWIHGGGNTVGHAGPYDGGRLASEQNVIVVTTNYRLGLLGWFRHPALGASARDARDASGNYGTLDLIRSLEWVRDNVAAFGGDPGNVTIFGESAGGFDVFTLLVAPGAQGLFARAISESGGTGSASVDEAEQYADAGGAKRSSRELVVRLLARAGTADARARADAMSGAETAALLRGASAQELIEAVIDDDEGAFMGMYRAPTVFRDGTVLPAEEIEDAIAAGRFHRVPVMLGTNRDETKLFMLGDPDQVFRLFWLFPMLRDADQYDRNAEYGSRLWKVSGADAPAAAMVAAGHPDVFVYRFDWDEQGTFLVSDLSRLIGAAHGLEIAFVFDSFDRGMIARLAGRGENPGRADLGRAVRDYWAQFARTGDPGTGGRSHPRWTAWSNAEGAPKFVLLDSPTDGGVRMSSEALSRGDVLDKLASDTRFADTAERCAYMESLVSFSDLEPEEYSERGCAEFPLPNVAAR